MLQLITLLRYACLAEPNNLCRKEILEFNKAAPFTHYQVCEYNRLRIWNESIVNKPDVIRFVVSRQRNERDWDERKLSIRGPRQGGPTAMETQGRTVLLHFPNDTVHFENPFVFLTIEGERYGLVQHLDGLLDLDVKYIGQTEISPGTYLRFKKHEKLSEVAHDIVAKRPEKESVVKLLSFGRPEANYIFLPFMSDEEADFSPTQHREALADMPEKQWRTVIEGALIHYFQTTEYNTHYVKHFPSRRHRYPYFYRHKVAALAIELQEEYMVYRTFRKGADPKRVRIIRYAFDDKYKAPLLINNEIQVSDELYEMLTGSLQTKFGRSIL